MKRSGWWVSFAWGVLLVPMLSGWAQAQSVPTQTHTFNVTSGGLTGWNGCICCYCTPTQRTPQSSGDNLDITLAADTIGYTYVSIQITVGYTYSQAGGSTFNVLLNGTAIGAGPSLTANTGCNQFGTATATTTLTLNPGNTLYNVGAVNTLRFTSTTGSCWGLLNGTTSGWCLQIVVTGLNQDPFAPTNPVQIGPDGFTIPVGGTCAGSTVRLRATVADPDNDDCFLETEFQPISVFFTQQPNFAGNPAPAGQDAVVDVTGVALGSYHWAIRSVDEFDFVSPWVSFGSNSEIVADVVMDNSVKPPAPIDNKNHGGGDCDISVGAAGTVLSPALLGLALLGFGLGRRKR
ncbi:MAG TPA: hypothetical protein VJS20_04600 [Gemmatimonadales bacterium]|nr:hypothetical protein [Gemmatimonadales bacterium]